MKCQKFAKYPYIGKILRKPRCLDINGTLSGDRGRSVYADNGVITISVGREVGGSPQVTSRFDSSVRLMPLSI